MSAVKFSDIQDGLRNIAFYFFAEAISENKLETFKELVKATNGFVYKQFGNEKEIVFGNELEESAIHIKNWFDNVNEAQNKIVEKLKEEGEDVSSEEDQESLMKAKVAHISMMFINNLTNYIISTYGEKIDSDGSFSHFAVKNKTIKQYAKDKDIKKLRDNLTDQLTDHIAKRKLDIPKSEISKMVTKMIKDLKEHLNNSNED